MYNDCMVIFGGFSFGERTNDIWKYYFNTNTWEKAVNKGTDAPCPRAGHSAVINSTNQHGDFMYIFGGKDDDNNKLNDTWKFDFFKGIWTQIGQKDEPVERSGHSA